MNKNMSISADVYERLRREKDGRRFSEVIAEQLDEEGRHAISSVTVTELYLGVEKGYERGTKPYETALVGLERLLSRFEQFDVTRLVGVNAVRIVADLQAGGERLDASTMCTWPRPLGAKNCLFWLRTSTISSD